MTLFQPVNTFLKRTSYLRERERDGERETQRERERERERETDRQTDRQTDRHTDRERERERERERGGTCADPESFVRGGPNLTFVFSLRGGRIKIPLLADHHWPASKTTFKCRAYDGPTLNAGLVALWF